MPKQGPCGHLWTLPCMLVIKSVGRGSQPSLRGWVAAGVPPAAVLGGWQCGDSTRLPAGTCPGRGWDLIPKAACFCNLGENPCRSSQPGTGSVGSVAVGGGRGGTDAGAPPGTSPAEGTCLDMALATTFTAQGSPVVFLE